MEEAPAPRTLRILKYSTPLPKAPAEPVCANLPTPHPPPPPPGKSPPWPSRGLLDPAKGRLLALPAPSWTFLLLPGTFLAPSCPLPAGGQGQGGSGSFPRKHCNALTGVVSIPCPRFRGSYQLAAPLFPVTRDACHGRQTQSDQGCATARAKASLLCREGGAPQDLFVSSWKWLHCPHSL